MKIAIIAKNSLASGGFRNLRTGGGGAFPRALYNFIPYAFVVRIRYILYTLHIDNNTFMRVMQTTFSKIIP